MTHFFEGQKEKEEDISIMVYKLTKQENYKALEKCFFDSRILVQSNPELMHKYNMHLPPLHYAADLGRLRLLDTMLSAVAFHSGGDNVLDMIDTPYNNQSPLLFAIQSRCTHCIKSLLDYGADPHFNIDPLVMMPLRFAVEWCSNAEICQVHFIL